MSPEMYALIDQNPFHLNIAPTTPTPAYPNKYNPDGDLVPYTREENPPSTQNSSCQRTTSKRGKTSTERATMYSTNMSTMHTKSPHQRLHLQQDGTRRCLYATSLTNWRQRTESQLLTQCASCREPMYSPDSHVKELSIELQENMATVGRKARTVDALRLLA